MARRHTSVDGLGDTSVPGRLSIKTNKTVPQSPLQSIDPDPLLWAKVTAKAGYIQKLQADSSEPFRIPTPPSSDDGDFVDALSSPTRALSPRTSQESIQPHFSPLATSRSSAPTVLPQPRPPFLVSKTNPSVTGVPTTPPPNPPIDPPSTLSNPPMYATPSMAPEAHHKSVLTHAPGSSAALEFAKRSRARDALEDALPQGAKQYASALAEEEMDVESLPLCSEADLINLGLPTGPRLKIMGHFGILRADGSPTAAVTNKNGSSSHHRQPPPSSSSLHGGDANSSSSSRDDALYGLQNEVARLAEVVEALQRSNNGISDALNRAEMENTELRNGQRELQARQARLSKRHSKLHAAVFSRAPTELDNADEDDEEAFFETGQYEIVDDDDEEEEEALSEYAEIGQGYGGNHSIDYSEAANDLPSRIDHLEYEDEDTGSLVHPEDMAAANAALAARDFMRRQEERGQNDHRTQAYDQGNNNEESDRDAQSMRSKEERKAAAVRRAAEVAVGARRAVGASSTAVTRAAGAAATVERELQRWSPPTSKASSPSSAQSRGARSAELSHHQQQPYNRNSVRTPPAAASPVHHRSPNARSPSLSVHSSGHKDYYGSSSGGGGGSPLSGGGTSSIGSLSERQAWAAALDAAEAEAANKEQEAKKAAEREKREAKRQEEALRAEEAAQWASSFATTPASSVPPVVGPSHSTGGTWVNHGRGTTVHALEDEWAQEKAARDREGKRRRDERQKVMEEFERGAAERAAQARAADEKARAERERIAKARADAASKLQASEEAVKKGAAAALEAETSARLAAEEQARRDKYKGMAQELNAREALKSQARQAEILKTHQDRQGFVPSSAKQQQFAEEEKEKATGNKSAASDSDKKDRYSKESSRHSSSSNRALSSRSSSPRPSINNNSNSSKGRTRSRSSPRDGSRRHGKGNEAVADTVHPSSSSASVDSSSTASSSVAPSFAQDQQTSSSSSAEHAPYSSNNAGPTPSKEPRQSVTSPNQAHVMAADRRAAETQAKGEASVQRAMSAAVAQRQSAEIKAVIDRNRPRTTALRANIVHRHATPASAPDRSSSSSRTTTPARTTSPRPSSPRPSSPRSSSPRPSTAAAAEVPAASPVMPLRWFS